jgi:hypothetical protein
MSIGEAWRKRLAMRGIDTRAVLREIRAISPAHADIVEVLIEDGAAAAQRLRRDRDQAIRNFAAVFYPGLRREPCARAIWRDLRIRCERWRPAAERCSPARDAKTEALDRILDLTGGHVLSVGSLKIILREGGN